MQCNTKVDREKTEKEEGQEITDKIPVGASGNTNHVNFHHMTVGYNNYIIQLTCA